MDTSNIHILKGDITTLSCDAIVNAANSSLLGGGGVDGAIHRAAGPGLLEECRTLNGCRTGEAKITSAYKLPSKYVIHTVGPVFRGGSKNEAALLASCYKESLNFVLSHSLHSIAFPAISTGVYGYPKKEACSTAVQTVVAYCVNHSISPDIYFVLFDNENYSLYEHELELISGNTPDDLHI